VKTPSAAAGHPFWAKGRDQGSSRNTTRGGKDHSMRRSIARRTVREGLTRDAEKHFPELNFRNPFYKRKGLILSHASGKAGNGDY